MVNDRPTDHIRSLAKSFGFAFRGLWRCILGERNMRIHLSVGFFILLFSPFYGFSPVEAALLAITIGGVLAAEVFNTAIETLVDMVSPNFNRLAAAAKDIAAGAVLISALTAAGVGAALLLKKEPFMDILNWFNTRPLLLIPLGIFVAGDLWFIFFFGRNWSRGRIKTANRVKTLKGSPGQPADGDEDTDKLPLN